MALLTSCWFIIETIVIPDGFRKWFYLSFYIHPIVLLFCQFFLWLKLLKRWLLVVVFYPLRIICFLALFASRFCRVCVTYIFSFSTRVTNVEVEEAETSEVFYDFDNSEVLQICNRYDQIVNSYSCSNMAPIICQLKVFEIQKDGFEEDNNHDDDTALHEDEDMEQPSFFLVKDMSKNDYFSSTCSSNSSIKVVNSNDELSICSSNSQANDQHINEHSPSVCGFNIPVEEREVRNQREEEVDAYYKKYTERMGWFDLLNYERTCGIGAILNKQLGSPSSFESIGTADFASKMAKKRLIRSLESDFELVYVAQSCLSWEALQHQYRRVKTMASSQNGVFYDNVAGEFQKFQVLLERFLEDERCEGKRTWNFVRGRFALKSLLQVPEISGFLEEEMEDMKGEAMSVKDVLRAIERCMQAFWVYVNTDTKKSWWKLRSSLWTYPPVEDPRDLELLADLNRRLRKNELCLKDLQGKERCWFRRVVNPVEESQRKEMLFTMIDMKLVSRVLQMCTLSSSQLKWCQEKLDNIEFKEGKVSRACTSPLFPSS